MKVDHAYFFISLFIFESDDIISYFVHSQVLLDIPSPNSYKYYSSVSNNQ